MQQKTLQNRYEHNNLSRRLIKMMRYWRDILRMRGKFMVMRIIEEVLG